MAHPALGHGRLLCGHRGRPVVLGGTGDPHRRGVVSTASGEARHFGVRSGMPRHTGHQRCPEAVFLPVDYATYRRVSRRAKAVQREFCALTEDAGIDDAYLDIFESAQHPADLARAVKQRVLEETGLPCSIGIGPSKLLARLPRTWTSPMG